MSTKEGKKPSNSPYQATQNVKPSVESKTQQKSKGSRRKQKSTPAPTSRKRGIRLAIQRTTEGAKKGPERTTAPRPFLELLNASRKRGYATKRKTELHTQCQVSFSRSGAPRGGSPAAKRGAPAISGPLSNSGPSRRAPTPRVSPGGPEIARAPSEKEDQNRFANTHPVLHRDPSEKVPIQIAIFSGFREATSRRLPLRRLPFQREGQTRVAERTSLPTPRARVHGYLGASRRHVRASSPNQVTHGERRRPRGNQNRTSRKTHLEYDQDSQRYHLPR